jgi:hypothetical protein
MTDHSKATLDAIHAVMALAERDVALGLVTADQIQAMGATNVAETATNDAAQSAENIDVDAKGSPRKRTRRR